MLEWDCLNAVWFPILLVIFSHISFVASKSIKFLEGCDAFSTRKLRTTLCRSEKKYPIWQPLTLRKQFDEYKSGNSTESDQNKKRNRNKLYETPPTTFNHFARFKTIVRSPRKARSLLLEQLAAKSTNNYVIIFLVKYRTSRVWLFLRRVGV